MSRSRWWQSLAVLCGGVWAGPNLAYAQAAVDPGWPTAAESLRALTVMIDADPARGCVAAGIISAHDASSIHIVTANHVVASLEEAGQSLEGVGVRIRRAQRGGEEVSEYHRAVGAVLRRDSDMDLAVIRVDDPVAASVVRRRRMDVMLGASELVPKDHVYSIGCGPGAHAWDHPRQATPLLELEPKTHALRFDPDYVRMGFSGGVLAHVFGRGSMLVGMTLSRGEGLDITRIVQRLLEWGLPVGLGVSSSANVRCKYTVAPRRVELSAGKDGSIVRVTTTNECGWDSLSDGAYWLHTTRTSDGVENPKQRTGSGELHFEPLFAENRRIVFDPCQLNSNRTTVYVAGQRVEVTWTCPPLPKQQ